MKVYLIATNKSRNVIYFIVEYNHIRIASVFCPLFFSSLEELYLPYSAGLSSQTSSKIWLHIYLDYFMT